MIKDGFMCLLAKWWQQTELLKATITSNTDPETVCPEIHHVCHGPALFFHSAVSETS